MANLLKETKEYLEHHGCSTEDIAYVGNGTDGCTWQEFEVIADVEYDNGYGSVEVDECLIILFKDGSHLRRSEYDGSEGWELITVPQVPENQDKLVHVLYKDTRGW